jgi:hypothetical protein
LTAAIKYERLRVKKNCTNIINGVKKITDVIETSLNMRKIKRNGNVSRKLMKLHVTATIGIISGIKPG